MDRNLYEIANVLLRDVCFCIGEEKLSEDRSKFLCQYLNGEYMDDKSELLEHELVMNEYLQKYGGSRAMYKKIMMLIVVSSTYKILTRDVAKGMDEENTSQILKELEFLTPNEIYQSFKNYRDNELILECVDCYFDYIASNYIFVNDCLECVINEGKIKELLEFNPFEIFAFVDYIKPSDFLCSERTIQNYLDIYNKALDDLEKENSCADGPMVNYLLLQQKMIELVHEMFNNDVEGIHNFYGYIFSNIYECAAMDYEHFKRLSNYHNLVGYFENDSITIQDAIDRYENDIKFFTTVIDIFTFENDCIEKDTLFARRKMIKNLNKESVSKKFNPYYEEEEKIFKEKIKQYNI